MTPKAYRKVDSGTDSLDSPFLSASLQVAGANFPGRWAKGAVAPLHSSLTSPSAPWVCPASAMGPLPLYTPSAATPLLLTPLHCHSCLQPQKAFRFMLRSRGSGFRSITSVAGAAVQHRAKCCSKHWRIVVLSTGRLAGTISSRRSCPPYHKHQSAESPR